jgi:hypothetical protein
MSIMQWPACMHLDIETRTKRCLLLNSKIDIIIGKARENKGPDSDENGCKKDLL